MRSYRLGVVERARHVARGPRANDVPDRIVDRLRARELLDGLAHLARGSPRRRPSSVRDEADHREGRRQQAAQRQVVERGHELAMGEVARGAEDHHAHSGPGTSPRRRPSRNGFAAAVVGTATLSSRACFTAWPPNWLRSAAMTLAE